jgi:hypothetical protein
VVAVNVSNCSSSWAGAGAPAFPLLSHLLVESRIPLGSDAWLRSSNFELLCAEWANHDSTMNAFRHNGKILDSIVPFDGIPVMNILPRI